MYSFSEDQIEFYDFIHPFGGQLNESNRWVKMSRLIPWRELEKSYKKKFSKKRGAPAKSARMAYGCLIIQEKCRFVDAELIEQITENPYLQFFIGLKEYQSKPPLDSSTLVDFRKRISLEDVQAAIELIFKEKEKTKEDSDKKDPPQKGQLIIDASCAPADITYPTDLKLLNHARKLTESIIDQLHAKDPQKKKKPRTYKNRARKEFLKVVKRKRNSAKQFQQARRQQLSFVQRNLRHIEKLSQSVSLTVLDRVLYHKLLVISEVSRQQELMLKQNEKSCEGRIVNIAQAHVRPIVRGKAQSKTEFGAKISLSVQKGYSFLHRVSFENYNECGDLQSQVEHYKKMNGFYPESVHADKIYRTRENLAFCKEKGIRLSGPRLGRPPKDLKLSKAQKKQVRLDEGIRNAVEGKFGQAKRRFGLDKIMAKLAATSCTKIAISILVLNLEKLLRFYFVQKSFVLGTHNLRFRLLSLILSIFEVIIGKTLPDTPLIRFKSF